MFSLQIGAFARSCSLLSVLCAAPIGAQGYRPVLTPAPGDPRADVEIERHANGQLSKRVFRLDGKPHGLWQEWDVEGRVRLTAEWREGKGEGVWMYFHPNGLVSERSWVTADQWHGPSEGWHANGQKSFEGTFVRGAKDGPFRYWAEDGTPSGPAAQLLSDTLGPVSAITDGWPAGMNVWDLSFSLDLETLFIGTGDDEGSNRRIMVRRWQRGGWQPVERAPFADSTAAEGTPMVSADGEWVYFSSARHAAAEPDNQHRDLYRASRASGWKTVERVTNTPRYGEVTLSLARDGTGVLWTDRRRDGENNMGMYEVRLTTADSASGPTLTFVGDLNDLHVGDSSGEAYPVIAPDASFVVFSNYDIGGLRTKEDMFISHRTQGGWSQPRRLVAGSNTSENDTASQILSDGTTLLFMSSRTNRSRPYTAALNAVLPDN
jgi:WD40-like Beta Propeller Repeat